MLTKYGLFDIGKIVDDCNNKKYSLVVAGWRIGGQGELQFCLENHYREIKTTKNYKIYIPE